MKKRIMSVLLALVMALSLCTVALAEPADGAGDSTTTTIDTIAFTLTGYAYGANTSNLVFTRTTNGSLNEALSGINIASRSIVTFNGLAVDPKWATAASPLAAGSYCLMVKYSIDTDNGFLPGQSMTTTLTLNGESCPLVDPDNNTTGGDGAVVSVSSENSTTYYTAYFALPSLTATPTTKTLDFVKTVVKGGNVVPPVTTFTFEQVTTDVSFSFNGDQSVGNNQGSATPQVTVTFDNIDTTGAGNYTGHIYLNGLQADIDQFLDNGFYVREKNPGAENWTYDDQVWLVQCKALSDVAGDLNVSVTDSTNDHVIVAKKALLTDNGYVGDDDEKWCYVENMTFTNTYTANRTTHHTPTPTPTAKIEAPKTFDAGIAVYGVMAVSSLFGMGYVGKKKF